jgi:hypothetical protein
MSKMSRLSFSAALVALCSFSGAAFAQGQTQTAQTAQQALSPARAPITPDQHSVATVGGRIHSGNGTSMQPGSAPSPAVSIGWHYVHATNCNAYWDGSTVWLYLYPSEGGYWFSSVPGSQNVMANQCLLGNWIAFYVYATDGSWNQAFTYTYK